MTSQPITTSEYKPPHPIYRVYSLLKVGPSAIFKRLYAQAYRRLTGTPVWGLTRITPFLYVGGQHGKRGLPAMAKEGITAVVNMRELIHDDVKKMIGTDNHLHLDTVDNTPITMEYMHKAADFIHQEKERGGKVYVHCAVGVGRAPSAAATYFIKYEGMRAEDALAKIKVVRPFIHPTSLQKEQLKKFEQDVQQ